MPRLYRRLTLVLLLTSAACSESGTAAGTTPLKVSSVDRRSPERDGDGAVQRGDFRFIQVSSLGHVGPAGVICNAPLFLRGGDYPLQKDPVHISDVPGQVDPKALGARLNYARRHNHAILAHPAFPYPDVCRGAREGEQDSNVVGSDFISGVEPVAVATGPARSLGDAARRGSIAETREWLARTPDVNAADDFGLTPLAWAVLRHRSGHVRLLLEAGANPALGSTDREEQKPLWLAARLGREEMFTTLAGRRSQAAPWSQSILEAAVRGGNVRLLRRLLREPHEGLNWIVMRTAAKESGAREAAAVLEEHGRKLCWSAPVPADAVVHLLAAYQPQPPPNQTYEEAIQDVERPIRITAARGSSPVMLVLNAYNPTRWEIAPSVARRVRGVLVQGYDPARVTGLRPDVPVVVNTFLNPCPNHPSGPFPHEPGPEMDQLRAKTERILGRPVDREQTAYEPASFDLSRSALARRR